MNQLIKKITATLLSLTMILGWVAFAQDVKVDAGSYATASFVRIYGTDRYDTANKIAARGWTTSKTVVLASGLSYADALAGAPLAYAMDAPVLLVSGKSVPQSVMQQIYALGATNIVILGGNAAVSNSIEDELKGKGFSVERVWGQTRYETAVCVAQKLTSLAGSSKEVFVVSGENYPDALAVSPVASLKGAPIVYSNKKGSIDSGSAALLKANGVDTAYVIGGTAAISDSVRTNLSQSGVSSVTRISGNSRYETALKVADHFVNVFTTKAIAFATGENYPDALAGGVFAAKMGIPVLLTNGKLNADEGSDIFLTASAASNNQSFTDALVAFIDRFKPEEVFVFGGENVVPNKTIDSYFAGETWGGTTTTSTTTTTVADTGTCAVSGAVYESFVPVTSTEITEHGEALSNVSIEIVPSSTGHDYVAGDPNTIRISTGRNGSFSIEGLKQGYYFFFLRKDGYEPTRYSFNLNGQTNVSATLYMYSNQLAEDTKGEINGYVLVNNEPVKGARIMIADDPAPKAWSVIAETDRNGSFTYSCDAGKYYLQADYLKDGEMASSDIYPVTVSAGKSVSVNLLISVEEEPALAVIKGTVKFGDNVPVCGGDPAPGAQVLLLESGTKEVVAETYTDYEDGSYSFEVAPGSYYLESYHPTPMGNYETTKEYKIRVEVDKSYSVPLTLELIDSDDNTPDEPPVTGSKKRFSVARKITVDNGSPTQLVVEVRPILDEAPGNSEAYAKVKSFVASKGAASEKDLIDAGINSSGLLHDLPVHKSTPSESGMIYFDLECDTLYCVDVYFAKGALKPFYIYVPENDLSKYMNENDSWYGEFDMGYIHLWNQTYEPAYLD